MPGIQKLITNHLDIWTASIEKKSSAGRGSSKKINLYGIKKLRELILELAVRGKLVPQDPKDEPASVLLKKIAAEKARLIKEGKIKKQKQLPPISDKEKPFELPKGWEWVRFNDLFNSIFSGGTPSKSNTTYWDGNISWASVKDLGKERYISSTQDKITETGLKNGSRLADKDDLLICTRMGLGKIAIAATPIAYNQDLKAVKLTSCINIDFFLNTYSTLKIKGTGTTVAGIKQEQLLGYVIGLPPFAEQHRIVAKVEELMALCDQLEEETENNITAHQTLVNTLLATLTDSQNAEDFARNWARIAEHFDTLFTTEDSIIIFRKIILELAASGKLVNFDVSAKKELVLNLISFGPRNGMSPKVVNYKTNMKVLKLGATSKGYLDLTESKYIDKEIAPESHLRLREWDILIQRGNSSDYVGCNLLIKDNFVSFIYPDLMMKIRAKEYVMPEYLSLVLASPSSREKMWQQMTGTSESMPKITKKVVENIEVWLPNYDTQRTIVAKVDELMALCEQLKSRLSEAQTIQSQLADALVEQAVA
ncbi:MAG: restriction endonuclease subunit S [Candidatus Nitrohelix vancouverensis]|uniref:Restriction endonuclease subunit S n=1 Tax=Candidatus Nitrohelix vancouverensis TaxID=2705534 RepID=A0A7T0C1K6_9BACT|nr:MAG: restriction endonuclease subunit S [Candidatus Nitrohelix vancouverensis]